VMMDGIDVLEQVSSNEIGDDDAAVVYGYVDPEADAFTIVAEVVALGLRGAYTIVECEVEGSVTTDLSSFPCESESEDDVMIDDIDDDVVITIAMIRGSKLFNRQGEPALPQQIRGGVDIEAEGDLVKTGKPGVLDRLDAFIVFVDDDANEEVEGILHAIDLAKRELVVIDEGVEHCVAYDDDTMFYKVTDDGDKTEGGIVTVAELDEGVEVEAEGIFDDGCLHAEEIIFEIEISGDDPD
jgi:hypothetical protein